MRSWHRLQSRNQHRPLRLGSASFWLEGVTLPLALLVLQALPLSALLQLGAAWATQDPSQALLPTWVLLLLLIESYALARQRAAHARLKGWVTTLIGAGGLITLLLIWYLRLYHTSSPFWQPGWLGALFQDVQSGGERVGALAGLLILLVLLWWRGLVLGRRAIEFEQVSRSFKLGFAILSVTFLFVGTVEPAAQSALAVQLGLALPLVLFVGLAGLSLARLAEIRRERRAHGNTQADPTRSWIIAMLVLSGGLVLLALGIEQAFSYQMLLGVVSALQPVWEAIGTVLYWIIIGISFGLYWITHPLVQLVRTILGGESQNQNTTTPTSPNRPKLPPNGSAGGIPAEWLIAGRWVFVALGILVALVIVLRALRAFAAWRQSDEVEEERESLGVTRMLSAQLRALLANLAIRFQQKRAARAQGTDADQGVRALYRRVLHQAAAQGMARHLPETTQEFARRLGAALARQQATPPGPSGAADRSAPGEPLPRPAFSDSDLDTLTAAYEQTRYGNREPPLPEVKTLHERVERLLSRLAQWQLP